MNLGQTLEGVLSGLLTMKEAAAWAEQHAAEFGLETAPSHDTLKGAALAGRLTAGRKGDLWLTRPEELADYLRNYVEREKIPKRRGGAAGARGRKVSSLK